MSDIEKKIHKAFEEKDWKEIKSNDSWGIFKIMAEFVEGYDKLAKIGPCVSIFGSARTKDDQKFYLLAEEIAYKVTQHGYGVITGGGPGIMEAANKGAKRGGGKSVGLAIALPFEEASNKYIDRDKKIDFDYFFVRKVMFTKYSQGFIVLPGGMGTLDELFEAITLIQTKKIASISLAFLAGPTAYFLLSNFTVWSFGGGWNRPKTFSGLMQCYVDGIPFYANSMLATFIFGAVLFGAYSLFTKNKEAIA